MHNALRFQNHPRVRDPAVNIHLRPALSERRSLLEKDDLPGIGEMSFQLVDQPTFHQQLRAHGRTGKRNVHSQKHHIIDT